MNEHKEYLLMKVLGVKYTDNDIMDGLSEDQMEKLKVRNVCARLPEWLVNDLNSACEVMNISKTKFIHNALCSYLSDFDELIEAYQVFGDKNNG